MISSSKVSLRVGKLREDFPRRTPNLVQTIVSQTSSYIVCFYFLCWAFKKFHFGEFAFQMVPKFCLNNCLTNIFLHCEFQLFMLNSLKILFKYEFKLSMSSRSKWPTFWEEPFDVELQKNICKQPPIGLHFHQLSDFYIKRSRNS